MTASDCLFCKIIAGEIPSQKVLEGDHFYAFHDIDPKAPVHVLVIPKRHTPSVSDTEDPQVFADALAGVRAVAKHLNLEHYRVVVNNGTGAGQTVFHLHFHLIAGRALHWPPG